MRVLFIILVSLPLYCVGQGNLVPNPSFEDYEGCPQMAGQWSNVNHWSNANGSSPDYFHVCASSNYSFGTPHNLFGHQYPHDGEAYMGLYAMQLPDINGREYIQVELSDSLVYSIRYIVSFHASLAEGSRYALSTLGAYLSKEPLISNSFSVFDVEPQILSSPLYPLTDTVNWTLITGTFTSRTGGEKFITIGNFHRDVDSDTLFFNPNPPLGNRCAYYYIDDVSVIALDSIPNSVEENDANSRRFAVYPNPSNGEMMLEYVMQDGEHGMLEVFDLIGNRLFSKPLTSETNNLSIELKSVPSGLYLLTVSIDGLRVGSEKVSITK